MLIINSYRRAKCISSLTILAQLLPSVMVNLARREHDLSNILSIFPKQSLSSRLAKVSDKKVCEDQPLDPVKSSKSSVSFLLLRSFILSLSPGTMLTAGTRLESACHGRTLQRTDGNLIKLERREVRRQGEGSLSPTGGDWTVWAAPRHHRHSHARHLLKTFFFSLNSVCQGS